MRNRPPNIASKISKNMWATKAYRCKKGENRIIKREAFWLRRAYPCS
jgi:hypothetical protein